MLVQQMEIGLQRATWVHGDVWDIENLPNKDWSIVHIKNKVTTSGSHTNLGLFIDDEKCR